MQIVLKLVQTLKWQLSNNISLIKQKISGGFGANVNKSGFYPSITSTHFTKQTFKWKIVISANNNRVQNKHWKLSKVKIIQRTLLHSKPKSIMDERNQFPFICYKHSPIPIVSRAFCSENPSKAFE